MNCRWISRYRRQARHSQSPGMCRLTGLVLLVSSCLTAWTALQADTGAEKVLLVKPGVVVSGTTVTLADLAEDLSSLPVEWSKRVILDAPAPGKSQSLSLMTVASALQKYPDMAGVTLRGACRMMVRRGGIPLDPGRVRAAVDDYIANNTDWQVAKIRVDLAESVNRIIVGSTNSSVHAVGFEYNPGTATHLFRIEMREEAGPVQRIAVPVRISAESRVWVAVHPIKQGSVIADDDVRAQSVTTDVGGRTTFPASDPIVGYEAERSILAGETISKTMVRQPVCTDKGSSVEVTAARGALQITLRARAMCKGRRGDQILCLNEGSKRQLLARLTAPGKAVLIGL